MSTPVSRSIDDFLNPDYRVIANNLWLKRWQKVCGVLAVITVLLLVYYTDKDLSEGDFTLLRRSLFELIIAAGTILTGIVIGLLLGLIPIKQLKYTQKLRLALFAGVFLSSATMLFMLLADL